MSIIIRQIQPEDNKTLAIIIRKVLEEFGVDRPGTVYTDPTTDSLFELFSAKNSIYWVAEIDKEIIGGCGIYPTAGLPSQCAELVKLYLSSKARGNGIGKQLMEKCFASALEMGYNKLYLESLPELENAVGLYQKTGFNFLKNSLGNSGHFGCNLWMLKNL